jgi:hypothetical protein
MICTVENCAIVPRVSLAVDVSARTLTCVLVIPSMGGMVGTGVGGSGVWLGKGIAVACRVAVTKSGVGISFSLAMLTPQPVRMPDDKSRRKMIE